MYIYNYIYIIHNQIRDDFVGIFKDIPILVILVRIFWTFHICNAMLGGQRSLQTAGGSWSGCAHFVSPVCHRDGDIVTKYQNYIDKMSILDVTHIRSPLDGDIFQVLSRLKCAKFGIEPDTGWVWLSSRHLGIPDVHGTQGSQVVPLGFFFQT